MPANERLVDGLRRSYLGGAWHGPALTELLAQVTPEAAHAPGPGGRSTWDSVLHLTAWLRAARTRLQGRAVELNAEQDWPTHGAPTAAAWAQAQADLAHEHLGLVDDVQALADADLQRRVPGRDYDVAFMLDGVIQHAAYHGAQIALLKKVGPDARRDLLRHTLATLAYRGGKALRGMPPEATSFRAAPGTRSVLEIVAHMGDLLAWALTLARGQHAWNPASPQAWDQEVARFFEGLRSFDALLASPEPLACPIERLFQGPIADALTHVGQVALLRRLAGSAVRAENYFRADVQVGRVGPEQTDARVQFE
jgi:uncharacterized damage-inducible protein DinB